MPGMMPAMKRSLTDSPVTTPYITMGMLGGIMTPSAPAEASRPVAHFRSYPISASMGIMRPPMAATVAGAEPDTAPKNRQESTAAMACPPGSLPTSLCAKSKRCRAIPPFVMRSPESIKRGTANSGKLSSAEKNAEIKKLACIPPVRRIYPTQTTRIAIPMGMDNPSRTKNARNNHPIIMFHPPCSLPAFERTFPPAGLWSRR